MRISEMKQREPFISTMIATLSRGWEEQYHEPITITSPLHDNGRTWYMQELLSCCFVDGLGAKPRQFLRDSFCYTPVKWRLPAQWLLGCMLTTTLGLRYAARPVFQISKHIPNERELLIMPGNQRIRVFDFRQGICRVILKEGFDDKTIKTEIKIRGKDLTGHFVPITSVDINGSWFEEPIVDGFALPRCPPWKSQQDFEKQALAVLSRWIKQHSHSIDSSIRVSVLHQSIYECLEKILQKFPQTNLSCIKNWVPVLCEIANGLGSIELSDTHGDFQPGNILIEKSTNKVFIIDWEHCRKRYYIYDFLVYGLRTRFSMGLSVRLKSFIEGKISAIPNDNFEIADDENWRKKALALFILEDLNWFLEESLTGPYNTISIGLSIYCEELNKFGASLSLLFGSKD